MNINSINILEKLEYINNTKLLIMENLNDLGAELTEDDTFRSYVNKINEIYSEFPEEEKEVYHK